MRDGQAESEINRSTTVLTEAAGARRRRVLGRAAIVAGLAIGGIGALVGGAAEASEVCPPHDSGKIDTTGDPISVTVSAPAGSLISGYCVKAGSSNQGGDTGPVFVVVDPPQETVTITHPSGKAVSHYSLTYVPTDPPPTDPPPTDPPPTDPPPTDPPPTDPPPTDPPPTDPPPTDPPPTDPPPTDAPPPPAPTLATTTSSVVVVVLPPPTFPRPTIEIAVSSTPPTSAATASPASSVVDARPPVAVDPPRRQPAAAPVGGLPETGGETEMALLAALLLAAGIGLVAVSRRGDAVD